MTYIIGITGGIHSGKDTVANWLCGCFNARKVAFADPLKDAAAIAFNVPREQFDTEQGKEMLDPQWNITRRDMLRTLGTDCFRDVFRKDFWTERMVLEIAKSDDKIIVIPDVRYEDEASFVRQQGTLMHIIRPENPEAFKMSDHPSDVGVAIQPGDTIILNDGDLDRLYAKLDGWVVL